MQWIKDSVLFISCCRNVFLLASGMLLVEYSKSFTSKFILESAQLRSRSNLSSSSVEWISKERSTLIPYVFFIFIYLFIIYVYFFIFCSA